MASEKEICSIFESGTGRFFQGRDQIELEHDGGDFGVDSRCGDEDCEGDVDAGEVDGDAAVDVEADGGAEDDEDDGEGGEEPYYYLVFSSVLVCGSGWGWRRTRREVGVSLPKSPTNMFFLWVLGWMEM